MTEMKAMQLWTEGDWIAAIAVVVLGVFLAIGAKIAIQKEPEFAGHPKGLYMLFFAEMWERFSYYGMQSLLALYLVKHLLQPGQADGLLFFGAFRRLYGGLDGQPLASAIVGTYFASVYVTPILGGLVVKIGSQMIDSSIRTRLNSLALAMKG